LRRLHSQEYPDYKYRPKKKQAITTSSKTTSNKSESQQNNIHNTSSSNRTASSRKRPASKRSDKKNGNGSSHSKKSRQQKQILENSLSFDASDGEYKSSDIQTLTPRSLCYSFSASDILPNSPESATLYDVFVDQNNSKVEFYEADLFNSSADLNELGSDENSRNFSSNILFDDGDSAMGNDCGGGNLNSEIQYITDANMISHAPIIFANDAVESDYYECKNIISVDTNLNFTSNAVAAMPVIYRNDDLNDQKIATFKYDHNYDMLNMNMTDADYHQSVDVAITQLDCNKTLNCDQLENCDIGPIDFDMNSFSNISSSNSGSHLEFLSEDVTDLLSLI
jgi:hypothetical protein